MKLELLTDTKQIDKLELYICQRCGSVFLFLGNVEDHKRIYTYYDFKIRPL